MLSHNLRNLRKARGLSQEELAIKLNVVRQTVSKWEKGLSVPDSEMLIRIAEELDTSVNVLLGEIAGADTDLNEKEELKVIATKLEILNEQFAKHNERKRKMWRTVFFILVALAIIIFLYELTALLYGWAAINGIHATSSAIGGYDGPTNIYVSNGSFQVWTLIIALIAAVISAVGIHKTRKK